MYSLKGKVAIVTGSSRGIGARIAVQLAQAGAQVVVNYTVRRKVVVFLASDEAGWISGQNIGANGGLA